MPIEESSRRHDKIPPEDEQTQWKACGLPYRGSLLDVRQVRTLFKSMDKHRYLDERDDEYGKLFRMYVINVLPGLTIKNTMVVGLKPSFSSSLGV